MKPTLIVNPTDDEIFGAYADLLVEHGAVSVEDLERRLRTVYPRATVHARDLSGESVLIWYVYRDGAWTRVAANRHSEEREPDGRSTRGSPVD
jgi:hypothetical protein